MHCTTRTALVYLQWSSVLYCYSLVTLRYWLFYTKLISSIKNNTTSGLTRNFRRSTIRERTGGARCEINLINTTTYSLNGYSFKYYLLSLLFTSGLLSFSITKTFFFFGCNEDSNDTLMLQFLSEYYLYERLFFVTYGLVVLRIVIKFLRDKK